MLILHIFFLVNLLTMLALELDLKYFMKSWYVSITFRSTMPFHFHGSFMDKDLIFSIYEVKTLNLQKEKLFVIAHVFCEGKRLVRSNSNVHTYLN